jgi:hypothetical protein
MARIYKSIAVLVGLVLMACCSLCAQEYVYVNTDNLIMRDKPEGKYMVYAVFHAPTKLKIVEPDPAYKDNKAVQSRFYEVSLGYARGRQVPLIYRGWVEKKYVVTDKSKITWPVPNKDIELIMTSVPIAIRPDLSWRPEDYNWQEFPAPEYKGGTNTPAVATRTYYAGPKGGCYYLNSSGRKVYVDKKFCDGN